MLICQWRIYREEAHLVSTLFCAARSADVKLEKLAHAVREENRDLAPYTKSTKANGNFQPADACRLMEPAAGRSRKLKTAGTKVEKG